MRRAAYVLIGLLALIGAFVVAMNVGWNLGVVPACGTPVETASSSPDGKFVLVVGVSKCGKSRVQTKARVVTASSKEHLVFLGSAESDEPIISPEWISATRLRLRYVSSAEITYPPDHLDALSSFGAVEVSYEPL
jgi:hypothetical protein